MLDWDNQDELGQREIMSPALWASNTLCPDSPQVLPIHPCWRKALNNKLFNDKLLFYFSVKSRDLSFFSKKFIKKFCLLTISRTFFWALGVIERVCSRKRANARRPVSLSDLITQVGRNQVINGCGKLPLRSSISHFGNSFIRKEMKRKFLLMKTIISFFSTSNLHST